MWAVLIIKTQKKRGLSPLAFALLPLLLFVDFRDQIALCSCPSNDETRSRNLEVVSKVMW